MVNKKQACASRFLHGAEWADGVKFLPLEKSQECFAMGWKVS